MFDFRYHALSLVAVFLALTIGLLLGVAIGDEGLVSTAGEKVRKQLRSEVRREQGRSSDLRRQLRESGKFADAAYPLLVEGRLPGARIGIVALGDLPGGTIDNVRNALKDTGGRLDTVAVIREPVPLDPLTDDAVIAALAPKPAAKKGAKVRRTALKPLSGDASTIRRYGRAIGIDLTQGGALVKHLRRDILSSSSGSFAGVEGVVLVRPGKDLKGNDARATKAFEDGLVAGMTLNNVPVVGTEETGADTSQIPWFKDRNLASVDDADEIAGRVALVYALAGARGTFGVKDTAESLLPNAR